MPFNNRSNNNRSSSFSTGSFAKKGKGGSKANDNFNMLSFGVAYLDEGVGKSVAKARILLKKEDNRVGIVDDKQVSYSREEAAALIAEALLEGRAIVIHYFENEDSVGGNARIDIKGLTESEPEPQPQQAVAKRKVAPAVRQYAPVAEDDSEESEEDLAY